MITPITRKELYLAKIIGEDVDIPETAKTREELFFLKILDNFSKIPEPITREELFLAKISGQDVELPEPKTRLELFLAKAAGMEIETPTPITREEMFWADYALIVEKEISGIPPLTFNAVEGTLKNYRIYGNTENKTRSYSGTAPLSFPITDGEVSNYRVYGKNSKNLLQNTATSRTINGVTFTVNEDGSVTCNGTASAITYLNLNENFNSTLYAGAKASFYQSGQQPAVNTYIIRIGKANRVGLQDFQMNNQVIIDNGDSLLLTIRINKGYTCDNLTFYPMLRKADITDDTYEPYGESVGDLVTDSQSEHYGEYTIPITNNSETANIYLDEPLRKVGDEAEYVDYAEQKWHRVRKNLLKNTMTSQTINGVTFTGNSDGSITCNGTASDNIVANIIPSAFSLPEGAYILNGAPPGGGQSYNFKLDVRLSTRIYYPDIGNGIQFNILQTEQITMCRIAIYSGYTCDNLTFYPMLRKADITDDTYEPYIENTKVDVTLPALPSQSTTNSLSVGTAIQPSSVAVHVDEIVSCGDKITDNQSVNYGKYKIPVTLTAGSAETTDIYLDEPLAKSGNNADYIDYATQKRHNSDGTESSVTLPKISTLTGTNTLSVGTEVQPQAIEIKGRVKEVTP